MHPPPTPADRGQLRELALTRAHALRRQAIQDFWAAAGRAVPRTAAALRRALQRTRAA